MENGIQLNELKAILNKYWIFLKKWKGLVLFFGLIGTLSGAFYAYQYKPYYIANLSFIINDTKSFSGGTLSALAGQLGMTTNGPNVTDDRILFLGRTKRILGSALLKKMKHEDIRIADKLAVVLRLKKTWVSDTTLCFFDKFSANHIEDLSYMENKAIDNIINYLLLSKRLNFESVSRKTSSFVGVQSTGIINISFECRNEQVSKEFVDAIYDELTSFYVNSILKNLQYNYDLISNKTDSIKELLTHTELENADASDATFNVFRFKGKINELRLRRDVEMLNILYAEGIKNKELAKFNLEQERPVFQMVDEPMYPLEIKDKSMYVYGFFGFFVCSIFGIGGLSILFLIKEKVY